MGTYKVGDAYKTTYPNPPVPPEGQHKIGTQIGIREGGVLVALYQVTATDGTNIEGKIIKVFKGKVPVDPRRGGPAANREVKPL